jgi:hypothetical protein
MFATKIHLSTSILPIGVLGGTGGKQEHKPLVHFAQKNQPLFMSGDMLYTDDGGVRPAGVLIVVKLHKCAPTNTLCQPPRVQANKLFLIVVAFPKGEHLQTKCAQHHFI